MKRFNFLIALAAFSGASLAWIMSAFVPRHRPVRAADVIIVLGHPAVDDGSPSAAIEEEITLAVNLFNAGKGKAVIVSGGAVRNTHIEAEVMADLARRLGLPAGALVVEANSRDTIENAAYCRRIMTDRDWHTAIVVTTPHHVRRADNIFDAEGIRHKMAYPATSYEFASCSRRLRALGYEVIGLAWLFASRKLGLKPFWQVAPRHGGKTLCEDVSQPGQEKDETLHYVG
ncbi:MAG: YdcF family protein [Chloroflexota bacterium]|nr:YdcF family protein [Chloroflexota bacterium]